jgi:hypothetical protein
MARSFNLMLTGNPRQGHAREDAARALAGLLRVPEARAFELLSGHETVVKRGLDGAALQRYLEALHQAGVETRKEEVFPPAPDPAVADSIQCPACGTEQPNLTICRQCGTDMPGLLAAKAAAARNPPPRPTVAVAVEVPRVAELDLPRYRRSRLLEVALFVFVSVLWGYLAMTDTTRGRGMRILGGITFAFFALVIVLRVTTYFGSDAEREAVLDAAVYAAKVADEVHRYAVANQRLPERTVAIDLPSGQPGAVKAVEIGPAGLVRVTLVDELKKAPGGVIVYSPRVDKGVIRWTCSWENVPADYLENICE